MATHRSPNCPQITFAVAAEKGRKVYEKEHTHPAPKTVVAADLGYAGISGRSLTLIGALRQYGILEGNSEGLRITDDAVAFYELDEGEERDAVIYRLVFKPPFFEHLRQQFGDTLPSEGTLRHYLIKEGFLQKAADEVIGVYRENLGLIKNIPNPYNQPARARTDTLDSTMATQPSFAPQPSQPHLPSQVSPSIYSVSFLLSAETKADLKISGIVSEDELEMLRDQIEMTIKALKRSSKSKPEASSQGEG